MLARQELYQLDHMFMCVICVEVCVERSEDNFVELVLSSHLYMDSGDRPQIIRLMWKVCLPIQPSHQLLIVD